ncbi:MAG: Bug family tripartite tricarboxylate transporter substrate binding protein [Burkholderiales bacterium]
MNRITHERHTKHFITLALGSVALSMALACAPMAAHAQSYPIKPIRTISTLSGGAELVARMVSQRLTDILGQPVIIETQNGAGGIVGQESVLRAAPDGYTLLFTSVGPHVMAPFVSKNARFDPINGYTPIAKIMESLFLIIANASTPFNTVGEMIDYAKRNPGKISYGTSGIGTVHHFAAAMITALTGVDWVHIPYKGGPPVLAATLSGEVQVGFVILLTMSSFANSSKLKVLGINNTARYAGMPAIATVTEQLPGYVPPPTWGSYFGPAGLPAPIVSRLNGEIVKIMHQPDIKGKVEGSGSVVSTTTPEGLAEQVRNDLVAVAKMVKLAGVRPE